MPSRVCSGRLSILRGLYGHLVWDVRLGRSATDADWAALRGAARTPGGGRHGRLLLLSHCRAPRDAAGDGSVAFGVPGRSGAAHEAHPLRSARLPLAAVLAASLDRGD